MTETARDEPASQAEFEAFYLRTARVLHGYLCRLSGDPATADEVLQEAFIRMIHAAAMEEAHRKAYLYATATNILRDRWRKQKREREWSELSQPETSVHQNFSLSLDMAAVFDRLSAQERAVLWLAHVEEMSHREIGAILNVKEKSVRVIVFRAREKAKELLERAGFRGSHE
ncbi:MAG TPA: RNA polymerase sigma factor [Verrucomicrobiae bacterium]|nr:RNA polymerase sigma factor [Verrucomicrobiae bacterium]